MERGKNNNVAMLAAGVLLALGGVVQAAMLDRTVVGIALLVAGAVVGFVGFKKMRSDGGGNAG